MSDTKQQTNEEAVCNLLADILPEYGIQKSASELRAALEAPKEKAFGDIAFPCHLLAKELKKAPPVIANELLVKVSDALSAYPSLTKAEAKGPYLNFFINNSALAATIIPSVLSGEFLARRPSKNERVMVEYSQPNTHKAFHVGHVRCASLGDTLSRILEWLGGDVIPVNYIGDEGTHVAKCLWYYEKFHKGEIPTTNKGEFLGKLYTDATSLLELACLTQAPLPGIRAAKVTGMTAHPTKADWQVISVHAAEGEKQIVTAGKGCKVNDLVAYAAPGVRFGPKTVGIVEKEGVRSEGMILSLKEIGFSEDNNTVVVLPSSAKVGDEVVEIYRTDPASEHTTPLLKILAQRESEVSAILQGMESGKGAIKELWVKTREWSLDEFKDIYGWLDCRFDHYFFESEFGERGKELARRFQEKGVFVESDGAVGADLKKWNLGFCILIKRDGTALYATRDLSLAEEKFDKYKIDRSLYVVDAGQTLHFQQVFKCLELMGYPQASKCYHLGYAQVVRPEGKMSSRKGNVILFSELKERLIGKAMSEFLEKYRGDWSDAEIDAAARAISLATIRYGMLKPENNSTVIFDLDEWTERSGNTGPYMLYAYTRIASILRDVGSRKDQAIQWDLLTHESEIDIVKKINEYPALIQRAADNYSPHLICAYVYELAKEFSRMYKFCPVSKAETEALKNARAALIEATGMVIEHALRLLGIPVLTRM